MTEINLNRDQYLEFEKISLGAFLPLTGFMNEEQFHSVVQDMRLPSGEVFPLPVVLGLTPTQAAAAKGRPRLALKFMDEEVGAISPEDFFTCDKRLVARQIFGTEDINHPGVANFFNLGEVFVGGPVTIYKQIRLDISKFELTPEQTKRIFVEKGWDTVVGFQTRNVPHRAHEYLQRVALEMVDGLFIQPLIGQKKRGDFTPQAIMTSYHTLIEQFYRADRVVLGSISTAMRYAGPREAVFHAIIRRNFGCTHFVVGRDHAGVGNYYGKYDAHDLTRCMDNELGIKIMRLHGPYYCAICDGIVTEKTCRHAETAPESVNEISGTEMRAALMRQVAPDHRFMRPEIANSIAGMQLFIE